MYAAWAQLYIAIHARQDEARDPSKGTCMFQIILTGLLPPILLVGLGGAVRRRLSENAWAGLDRLNFEILFPALIFVTAAARPIDPASLTLIGPLVWAILALGLGLGWLARPLGPARFLDFAGAWQTAWRFNTALGFVVVQALPSTDPALFSIIIGMAIPVANIFAVAGLSRGEGLRLGPALRKLALNPFLLASLGGVAVGVSGLTIPQPVLAPVSLLGQAAIPVALISIGATLNWRAMAKLDRFSACLVTTKLVALPAAVSLVALAVGAGPGLAPVLVVFAALPTASAAHVLAAGFGADRQLAATLIAQGTILAALTLPAWMAVAEMLARQ
ncbi:AEC family transporter [Lutimaribacter sp. EGI FJ00015]|uniref:AEC family transporter n=1 Tax=Lutimaribacter degradans TaxID=2945989 RepID=A0ACC5ZRK7_9RHOB|nr:AEC family transporter [Lutimaribacter sp. EGI FJ00013]MCM2560785.1 AEC family transporter [Lutimaribacter sp. EGI FJ00013]MCO0612269.1 AEC family transporter [Lutimaribacter sp. EGI FJ00015]MCO0634610.1 AEC family transporter [Lutimaribacter sp. EGI FJ00014]